MVWRPTSTLTLALALALVQAGTLTLTQTVTRTRTRTRTRTPYSTLNLTLTPLRIPGKRSEATLGAEWGPEDQLAPLGIDRAKLKEKVKAWTEPLTENEKKFIDLGCATYYTLHPEHGAAADPNPHRSPRPSPRPSRHPHPNPNPNPNPNPDPNPNPIPNP